MADSAPAGAPSPGSRPLADAVGRLDLALAALEAALARRLDVEARRGDLETELSIMQDDRARLAADLDGALSRLERLELAAADVDRRVERAMGEIRAAIAAAEASPRD